METIDQDPMVVRLRRSTHIYRSIYSMSSVTMAILLTAAVVPAWWRPPKRATAQSVEKRSEER